jgi:hypothetical protein
LCHRAIRALVVDYELRAPARSQERLIYRHGIHVITAVMMKRLRNRIGAAAVVDVAEMHYSARQTRSTNYDNTRSAWGNSA